MQPLVVSVGFGAIPGRLTFPKYHNPNAGRNVRSRRLGLQGHGSLRRAWGIRFSPVLRHQSGVNFARQISVPRQRGEPFGLTLPAIDTRMNAQRAARQHLGLRRPCRQDRFTLCPDRIRTWAFVDFQHHQQQRHASETITRTTGRRSCDRRTSWRRSRRGSGTFPVVSSTSAPVGESFGGRALRRFCPVAVLFSRDKRRVPG